MRPWTVLRVHNSYRHRGGEEQVFAAEEVLLTSAGHSVVRYEDHNDRITRNSLATGLNAIWSCASHRDIGSVVRKCAPDVVHFHNTFPLISPAAYYATKTHNVPIVQTLHNYRLLCPGATLHRDGRPCEECIQKHSLRPAIMHGCYRNSRPATSAVVAMLALHRLAHTWHRMVDVYIALSEFARRKFIEGGLPESRIVVNPNFVGADAGPGEGRGGYALFVGRNSSEKGI